MFWRIKIEVVEVVAELYQMLDGILLGLWIWIVDVAICIECTFELLHVTSKRIP